MHGRTVSGRSLRGPGGGDAVRPRLVGQGAHGGLLWNDPQDVRLRDAGRGFATAAV